MAVIQMSRGCSVVINHLVSVAQKHGVNIIPKPMDIFIAEQLAYTYSFNVINAAITKYYNPKSKNDPTSMAFYEKPIRSQNRGRISDDDWIGTEKFQIWHELATFAPSQLGKTDIEYIISSPPDMTCIKQGIDIARKSKIISIPYAAGIAIKEYASKIEVQRQQEEEFNAHKISESDIYSQIHKHSILEIAGLANEWSETVENIELERKVNSIREKGRYI